ETASSLRLNATSILKLLYSSVHKDCYLWCMDILRWAAFQRWRSVDIVLCSAPPGEQQLVARKFFFKRLYSTQDLLAAI
ncbi:MAG: hypothetical protein LBV36_02480, partial [Chromatiales bacterium]|nr:hypothetical protein [Chromatiales bacterium]